MNNKQNSENPKSCQVCQKPALHKCGNCRSVFYCDKIHQKADWKKHRSICKPFKISSDDAIGRHLIASRPIKSGEVVLREPPLVWGPALESAPVCLGCGKGVTGENSRPCQKCGWPVCGELCEKAPVHLPECRYTVQRGQRVIVKNFDGPHPIYRCITVLRCLYQKQFLSKIWKKLEVLESHCEQRKRSSGYENDRVMVAEFIRRFFKLSSVFEEEDIMRVLGIILINSHEVPLTDPPHIAIYGTASMFEHNCTANCSKSFTNDGQILITAAKPIAEGDHLSICYTDPLWGTPNRQHFLQQTKFFKCACPRCEDPTEFGTNFSAIKCQKPGCTGLLLPASFTQSNPLPVWTCSSCNKTVTSYSAHDVLEKIGRDLFDLDKTDAAACKQFLETARPYLSLNHYYCIDVKLALVQLLGVELSDDDLRLKLRLCRDLEGVSRVVAPAEKRLLGLVLFELHATLAEVSRRGGDVAELRKSREFLVEAIELLKYEPEVLPEGKVCKQARLNLKQIDLILGNIM